MKVFKSMSTLAAALAVVALVQVGWTAEKNEKPKSTQSLTEGYYAGNDGKTKALGVAEARSQEPAAYREACAMPASCEPGCEASCDLGECRSCCPCFQFYGDYLYLRPRNAGLEYAVPINGPISPGLVPIQEGRTAALNPDFQTGFRVGGGIGFDECSTISVGFMHYENSIDDSISSTQTPYVIRSMVLHPSSADAAADWLDASAHQYIRLNMADLDYRHVFYCSDRATANYLVGIRYANLLQTFGSQFESMIRENVDTEVKFDGAGIRIGVEAERTGWHNISVYGKASASFLGGEFRGAYFQGSTNDPVIVDTNWKEARLVSILDCEVGLGWTSCGGHVRASAGYMISGWLNAVKQAEFISAVQANKYHGPDKISGNGLVFDGLVAHVELRR